MRGKWDTGKTEKKKKSRQERKGHKIKKESVFRGNSSQASERKGTSVFLGGDRSHRLVGANFP